MRIQFPPLINKHLAQEDTQTFLEMYAVLSFLQKGKRVSQRKVGQVLLPHSIQRLMPRPANLSSQGGTTVSGTTHINVNNQPNKSTVIWEGTTLHLCRCWQSAKFPHCDGTHKKVNKDKGEIVGPVVVQLEPLKEKEK